jgi:hypothetical protein
MLNGPVGVNKVTTFPILGEGSIKSILGVNISNGQWKATVLPIAEHIRGEPGWQVVIGSCKQVKLTDNIWPINEPWTFKFKSGLGKRAPKKLNFLEIEKEVDYFVFGSYEEMIAVGGYFVCEGEINTPWPSVVEQDDDWDIHGQRCYSQTSWFYKASDEFKQWFLSEETKKEVKRKRRIIKARYKQLLRTLFKGKMKALKLLYRNSMEQCFLRLVLLTTSLLGWKQTSSLATLYGLVNFGFLLGIS